LIETTLAFAPIAPQPSYQDSFRQLVDEVSDCAMILLDRSGNVASWNSGAERIQGYTKEEIIGRHFSCFYRAEDIAGEKPRLILAEVLAKGRVAEEGLRVRKDASMFWASVTLSVLRDDSGGHSGFAAVTRDIGDRKAVEQQLEEANRRLAESELRMRSVLDNAALRASEDRLMRLVEADVVGILIVEDGEILEANPYVLKMLGYGRDNLLGSPISLQAISPPEYADLDEQCMRQGLETGAFSAVEKQYSRKDGARVPVLVGGLRIKETPPRFLWFVVDLTEVKRLEEQFRQSQKLESIGHLAGGVAHDFNNLLTVITGYAQMARAELTVDHPLYEPIDEISKASARAAALTRQLLTFSRRQPSSPRPVALNDLVKNLDKMLKRLIGEDIELTVSLNAGHDVILADPGHVEQVIVNLAVNARDAMTNSGKLRIETSNLFADEQFAHMHLSVTKGEHVKLTLTDTGAGMSREVQTRIFEPFFTTKPQGKGSGLGLSTVYGIVKQSKGTIWVYSEEGLGSTFNVLFPVTEGAREKVQPDSVEAIPAGSGTILLAEDEPGVRKYVTQVLERSGYRVIVASNGREAIELARRHIDNIDLLLTDVVMPEMGGLELAGHFTALLPGVPVLCMSGYTDRDVRQEEAKMPTIPKPFSPAALLTQIRKMLASAPFL
jgi:two-component system cell cycle sensor histidine kinase/response regulator CckA